MNITKRNILDKLIRVIQSDDEEVHARMSALSVLLKHDIDRARTLVEEMYNNSEGTSFVTVAKMALQVLDYDKRHINKGGGISLDEETDDGYGHGSQE